jgi:hypothetical protein
MRTIQWLFVVGVLLFVSGIGFVVAAARTARAARPVEAAVTITPVASVKQIMAAVTGPSANVVYNAVQTIVSKDGVKEVAPQTDEEWAAVGSSAAALAESANLLMTEGRAIDKGDWAKMAQQLVDASKIALKAANDKSTSGILDSGSAINDTCDNCHAKYQRQ